jgi:hypothetical protein
MDENSGLWAASTETFMRNLLAAGLYVGAMMVIGFGEEFLPSNSGFSFGRALVAAFLAMPAHLYVLKGLTGTKAMSDKIVSDKFMSFTLRAFGLSILALILPFIVFLVCILMERGLVTSISIAGPCFLLSTAFVFARWGTVLPAVIMSDAKTLKAASERSKASFRYAFPRLLVSFGFLTFAMVFPVVILTVVFEAGETFMKPDGGIDIPLVVGALAATIIGAYQIVMTAVILSRSYLRALPSTSSQA